ncbi:MAG: Gfo/Idh/MocA family oxidoreductase [Leptolyngbyaceae cyanobacterium SM1_1_3]|nr:Gfo/Idh/MocA family oxidoreductase [Leptolyngbyaceae cyanobacterium SM1_1_3]NJN01332.1 Gfo/Idh/MocA family oxidoreductase [Leptolyngbyaceae cyanobacterium RM1_1_2]NJO09905.1 Gfo/Idh/MocA family oxidoreductase [Leptolyngbyaceae cyanobacterium SL_1_1]
MTATLKAAVIGTGLISKEHLTFLEASALSELVGVCDLSPAAAGYAAQHFKAQAAFTDYHEMLATAKPDVVHILTPPQLHKTMASDCLKAGSHVICEKPITLSYDDFKDLWEVAQQCDRYLIEDQNYRFNEPILDMQRLIAAGDIGDVQEIEVRLVLDLRSGGRFADENLPSPVHKLPAGVIHDFITHLCYLVFTFAPEAEFNRISAAWSNHGGGDLFKYDDLDALLISEAVHARIRFSCHTQPDCIAVTVRGAKGYVETDLFQPYLRCVMPRSVGKQLTPLTNQFLTGREFVNASIRNFRQKVMQKTPYEGLHRLLDQTYKAILNGSAPPISFDDMARSSRLVEALLLEANRL